MLVGCMLVALVVGCSDCCYDDQLTLEAAAGSARNARFLRDGLLRPIVVKPNQMVHVSHHEPSFPDQWLLRT